MSAGPGTVLPPFMVGPRGREPLPERVKLYDFRRPDKFTKDQIRTMQILAETFGKLAETALSAKLRTLVALELDTVDQETYDEFTAPLCAPTVLAVATMRPLKGQAVLRISMDAADAILERAFGSQDAVLPEALKRELTDIECASMERLMPAFLNPLASAWEFAGALETELVTLETNPRFCQIVPPNEMIIITSFRLKVGGSEGRLDVVYPFLLLEPLISKLSAKYWYSRRVPKEDRPLEATARATRLPAELVCPAGKISVGELSRVKRGTVIPLPALDQGRTVLRLGGRVVAVCPGTRKDGGDWTACANGSHAQRPNGEGDDTPAAVAAGIKDALSSLKSGLAEAVDGLGKRIDELKGSQEDMADRVFYGQADAQERRRPFQELGGADAKALALFLANERAQLCALVLSHLDEAAGARVLPFLPDAAQADIIRRVALFDGAPQDVVTEVDRVLGVKMAAIERSRASQGSMGLSKAVGILSLVPRDTEKLVIGTMESANAELAESIKRNMFVFEDIVILDDESVEAVLNMADRQDLLVAMKVMDDRERERLFARFPAAARDGLRAEYKTLGRKRVRECDEAGARVVAVIKALEEEGRIGILRADEG
ncbi:MAG: hypothetical protein KBB32_11185 [Spirochaetia bacterium]|nr:hypothetical protein [Spirochaetia bacterium]